MGPLTLIPYERGERPGDQLHAAQADIDGVLSAYALRKSELVSVATLMELGDWRIGQDSDVRTRAGLFRARELVGFAALAERRLFRGHFDYCNFDTYAFVIQHYGSGNPGTFSFSTRRRDSVTQHLWNADEFAFMRPLHVGSHAGMKFDTVFLAGLLKADDDGSLPYEAIVEFNRANTYSQDVPTHTEVVLIKSALEYLFAIGQSAPEFVGALRDMIPERKAEEPPKGPLESRWKEARPKATRPLEAWAREFCDVRGGAAHGQKRGGGRFVWSEDAHLAFASILFPLLVKHRVARESLFTLPEHDALELEYIEDYLMHDPFAPPSDTQEELNQHPWNGVYSDVQSEALSRGLLREMRRIDWANLPRE